MKILTEERTAVERLHSFFDCFSAEIDQKTRKILLYLGFSPKLDGYNYICYAMRLILNDASLLKNLTTGLYPIIAEKFSVKPHCVERSMRHAVDVAVWSGRMERINRIIGVEVYDNRIKITNGELLSIIAEAIKLEYARNAVL